MSFEDLDNAYEGRGARSAGPAGLNQRASERALFSDLDRIAGSESNRNQPTWQTGGQLGSTENGWNTDWMQKMVDSQNAAADAGMNTVELYRSKNFTGLVTADFKGSGMQDMQDYKFGDIYEDGVKQGNIFDENSGYTKGEALQVVGQFMSGIDTAEYNKQFGGIKSEADLEKRIFQEAQKNASMTVNAINQDAFRGRVQDRKDEWDDTAEGWATFGGGAGGGAAIGAGIGAFFTPVGAAIGAGFGALVGGFGALLNKDTIVNQVAEASVRVDMAGATGNGALVTGAVLEGVGAGIMTSISPLQNWVQGTADAAITGQIGDDKGYYDIEDKGGFETANMVALFADSALQFLSPVARAVYMGGMGSTATGRATQYGADLFSDDDNVGLWDVGRARFDGADDVGQSLAGAGVVAIDFLQLGLGAGAGSIARGALANSAALQTSRAVRWAAQTADDVTVGALKFGTVSGKTGMQLKGFNASILVPSEALNTATALLQARRLAGKAPAGQTPAQFQQRLYLAASGYQSSTRDLIVLNGLAEGYEEAAQEALESLAHGNEIDMSAVANAAIMGALGGAGMGAGTAGSRAMNLRRGHAQENVKRVEAEYRRLVDTGSSPAEAAEKSQKARISLEEFKESVNVSEYERATTTTQFDPQVQAAMQMQVESLKTTEIQNNEMVHETVMAELIRRDKMNENIPGLAGVYRITGRLEGKVPTHHLQANAKTVFGILDKQMKARNAELQRRKAAGADVSALTEEVRAAAQLVSELEALMPRIRNREANPEDAARAVQQFNRILRLAYRDRTPEGAFTFRAMAATALISRNPRNSTGSQQALLPQILEGMEELGPRDGFLSVSSAVLEAMGGDYDGDAVVVEDMFAWSDNIQTYENYRVGISLAQSGGAKMRTSTALDHAIRMLGIAHLNGGSDRVLAEKFISQITMRLKSTLPGFAGWDNVVDDFAVNLRQGDPDAKEKLLNAVATGERAAQIVAASLSGIAFDRWNGSVFHGIETEINAFAEAFRMARMERLDRETGTMGTIPVTKVGTVTQRAARDASTAGMSLALALQGKDPFRTVGFLKYHSRRAANVDNTDLLNLPRELNAAEMDEWVRLFTELESGEFRSGTEATTGMNDVAWIAQAILKKTWRHLVQEEGVSPNFANIHELAGMSIDKIEPGPSGILERTGTWTFAEMAVSRAVSLVRHRAAGVLEQNVDLANKLNALSNLSFGAAYRELFGQADPVVVLGEGGLSIGANSFDHARIILLNMDPLQRDQAEATLKSDIRYGGGKKGIGYTADDLLAGEVSPYRVFVDALLEETNTYLTLTDPIKGTIGGRRAEGDKRLQDSFAAGLGAFRTGANKAAQLLGLKKLETIEDLNQVLQQNPTMTSMLMKSLGPDVLYTDFSIDPRTGLVSVPNWLKTALLDTNSERAAKTVWWQMVMSKVRAYESTAMTKQSDDRMVRLLVKVSQDKPALLDQILARVAQAESIEEALSVVNSLYQHGAPQLAFYRDAAEFDPAEWDGGWSKSLPGAELREAMQKFIASAQRWDSEVAAAADVYQSDMQTAIDLSNDPDLFMRLEKVMEWSKSNAIGVAPNEILSFVEQEISGVNKGLTDKAGDPAHIMAFALNNARGENPTGSEGFIQALDSRTAYSVEQVLMNPTLLQQKSLILEGEDGRVFEWRPFDAAQAVELLRGGLKDPNDPAQGYTGSTKYYPLIKALLMPSAYRYSDAGNGSLQHVALTPDTSLRTLLRSDVDRDALELRTLNDALTYISRVDALASKEGGNYDLTRQVVALATTWANTAKFRRSDRFYAEKAAMAVARMYKATTQLGSEAVEELAVHALAKLTSTPLTARQPGEAKEEANARLELMEIALEKAMARDIQAAMKTGDILVMGQLERQQKALLEIMQANEGLFEAQLRVFTPPKDLYSIEGTAWRRRVQTVVLLNRAGLATSGSQAVDRLLEMEAVDADGLRTFTTPARAADDWAELGRAAASAVIQNATSEIGARLSAAILPASLEVELFNAVSGEINRSMLGTNKYFDPSFSFLISDMLDSNTPARKAAAKFRDQVIGEEVDVADPRRAGELLDEIYDSKLYDFQLTPELSTILVNSAVERLNSAGVSKAVTLAGSLFAQDGAMARATERTFADPAKAGVKERKYVIPPSVTAVMIENFDDLDVVDAMVLGENHPAESLAFLNGRFVTSLKVIYTDGNGAEQTIDIHGANNPSATYSYLGQKDQSTQSLEYDATSLDAIQGVLRSVAKDKANVRVEAEVWHPDDKPADPTFANNLYFEGMVFNNGLTDATASLIGALDFGNSGRSANEAPFKAKKKGQVALRHPVLGEGMFDLGTDYTRLPELLREEARYLLSLDLGYGSLDFTLYNAVRKMLTLNHLVRAIVQNDDGTSSVVVYSVEQVLAAIASGEQLAGDQFQVVPKSQRAVRTMLGERLPYSIARWTEAHGNGLEDVRPWLGIVDDEHVRMLPGLVELDENGQYAELTLDESGLLSGTQLRRGGGVIMHEENSSVQITEFNAQWEVLRKTVQDSRFDQSMGQSYMAQDVAVKGYLQRYMDQVLAKVPALALSQNSPNFVLPSSLDPLNEPAFRAALQDIDKMREVEASIGSTSWIITGEKVKSLSGGTLGRSVITGVDNVLHGGSKDHSSIGRHVAPDDLAVLLLSNESFPGTSMDERVESVAPYVRRLTSVGAYVALTSGDTADLELVNRVGGLLRENGYTPVAGSRGLWKPAPRVPGIGISHQARLSRELEVENINRIHRSAVILSNDVADEGTLLLNSQRNALANARYWVSEMVPFDGHPGYSLGRDRQTKDEIHQLLHGISTEPELLDAVVEAALLAENDLGTGHLRKDADTLRKEIKDAASHAATNLNMTHMERALPQVGTLFSTGDFLVLASPAQPNRPRKFILIRHGHEVPSPEVLDKQFALMEEKNRTARAQQPDAKQMPMVAVYPGAPRALSSSHKDLQIAGWGPEDGSLPRLMGTVSLQQLGLRTFLDPQGIKATVMAMDNDSMRVPDVDVLDNMPISFVSSYADRKNVANMDVVRNYRNAIAFIGMDFVPMYAEALLGITAKRWAASTRDERRMWEQEITNLFRQVRAQAGYEFNETQVRALRDALLAPTTSLTKVLAEVPFINSVLPKFSKNGTVGQLSLAQFATLNAIVYMHLPSAHPSHILASNGLGGAHTTSSTLMPAMFTEAFDMLTESPDSVSTLHSEMIQLFNARLGKNSDGDGFYLSDNWTIRAQNPRGEEKYDVTGYLAFPKLRPSPESATLDESVNNRRGGTSGTEATNRVLRIGGLLKQFTDREANQKQVESASRLTIPAVELRSDVYNMLHGGLANAAKPRGPKGTTGISSIVYAAYADAARQFEQPISREVRDGLSKGDLVEIEAMTLAIMRRLSTDKVKATSTDVDQWVRQQTSSPKSRDPQTEAQEGLISGSWWKQALTAINNNLDAGMPPTFNSRVPMMTYRNARLFAAAAAAGKITLRSSPNGEEINGQDEQEVYKWAIGQANASTTLHQAFLPAIDGMLHTFRLAEGDAAGVPISVDTMRSLQMLDPATDDLLLSSNSALQARLNNPQAFWASNHTGSISQLLGGNWNPETGQFTGDYPEAGFYSEQDKKLSKWSKSMPFVAAQQSRTDLVRSGTQMIYDGSTISPWVETVLLLRYTQALANPAIITASIIDNSIRGGNAQLAQLLTGESVGIISKSIALARKDTKALEAIEKDRRVINALTTDAARGEILSELQRLPAHRARGGLYNLLSKSAHALSLAQDWTIGTKQTTLMSIYWNSIRAEYERAPEVYDPNNIGIDMIRSHMQTDPLYVKKNFTELHNIGVQRLRSTRGLKLTSLGVLMNKGINRLTESPSQAVNSVANLTIQTQFMFRNFLLGTAVEYAGLRTADAALAFVFQMLQDRVRTARGLDQRQDYLDQVLDSTNLANMMVRDGISHSMLLLGGLTFAGAGLTDGDDPEERRRKRAARLAGLVLNNDPRDIANDMRNADAIYFDQLPPELFSGLQDATRTQSAEDGTVHSMAQLHWTLKQFVSPALGIAEAINTGDFRHVMWGFEDAFLSMPLAQATMWSDAVETNRMLQNRAAAYAETGDPAYLPHTTDLLMQVVWNYERMLFENSFINNLYQSLDTYDRNPYRLVDLDADGNIQRNDLGVPMGSDELKSYINDDGTVSQGWLQPDGATREIREKAESRFTVALFGSLVNGLGGQPSMMRTNMAVQQVNIKRGELDMNEVETIIASQYNEELGEEVLTTEGAEAILRGLHLGSVRPGDPGLDGVYITNDQRWAVAEIMRDKNIRDSIALGLTPEEAEKRWDNIWYGNAGNSQVTPLYEVIFSTGDFEGAIPKSGTVKYNQLNTTFVRNPVSGEWLATGIGRNSLENFFGNVLNVPSLMAYNAGAGGGVASVDASLNTTDQMGNLNTGRRGLQRADEDWDNINEDDLLEAIKALDGKGAASGYTGSRYNGGGYGRGSSSWSYRLNSPVRNDPTYARNIPYLNVDNPIIRRATIRRERFSSTRGRLNQWQ